MLSVIQLLRHLFDDAKKASERAIPRSELTHSQLVDMMYDQSLSSFVGHEIVKVVYSPDREKRIVVLRREDWFFCFRMERIVEFPDDEWYGGDLPAMWEVFGAPGPSLFGTEREAWHEIVCTPEFKQYFDSSSDGRQ